MKKIFLVLMMFTALRVAAQKFSGTLNFQLGFPQGEYKVVNGKTGVGMRFNLLYKPSLQAPVSMGLELGLMTIGNRTSRFSSSVYGFYDEYVLNATNNVFSALLNVRISPLKPGSAIMPFADASFGWNDFFSTVTVSRDTYYNDNGSQSNSSKARWANTYGAGAGLDIRLNKRGTLYLELKTSYLVGNKTKYLTDPTIYNDGSITFAEKQSETDLLIPQAGIHFNF